ncbi:dynein light chain Tctex-type 5-like [Arctopsyche grandis]|uniref:dynein light chain Tctex-type 5-like n=1 Tax=Arctopsyche grandis TaxID=121162 RepID=UPI00406DA368
MSIEESKKHVRTHQNTYRVEPKRPFDVAKTKIHLKNVLELNLKEIEYSDQCAKELCFTIVEEIKTGIKSENFDRYRIIVAVVIGEKKMQGVQINHTFLWDPRRDKYVNHLYETNNFYAQATVYGVYLD